MVHTSSSCWFDHVIVVVTEHRSVTRMPRRLLNFDMVCSQRGATITCYTLHIICKGLFLWDLQCWVWLCCLMQSLFPFLYHWTTSTITFGISQLNPLSWMTININKVRKVFPCYWGGVRMRVNHVTKIDISSLRN